MKARILGFALDVTPAISLASLFTHLKAMNGVATKFGPYERIVFIGDNETYFTGLFLTTKSHKRFCELARDGEAMTINVREVTKGSSMIDFNFFVVHKQTGRGLYQHYHNSCSCQMFVKFCATEYQNLLDDTRDAEIFKAGKNITDSERLKIEKKYAEPMACSILVRPESFAALVAKFKSISGFEFNLTTIAAETEQRYRGLQGKAKRIVHRVSFNREVGLAERASTILGFFDADADIGDASVDGVGDDGLAQTISLYDNPDSFGSYEFDSLAQNMDFEPKNFAESVFMGEMIRVADSHKKLLGKAAS